MSFNEDVPDLRNSKVAELYAELAGYGARLHVHDAHADPKEAREEYGIELQSWEQLPAADATPV